LRSLWFGTARYIDESLQRLLAAARQRPTESLAGRELRVEVAFAALFLLAAAALAVLLPSPRELSVATALTLVFAYAVASRVEFATGIGFTVPTQLVLVPMLFFLPTPWSRCSSRRGCCSAGYRGT
jgi:hypothetical protein